MLTVLALIACLAIIAALYSVTAEYTLRAATNTRGQLASELLALSACEELAAYATIGKVPPAAFRRSITNGAGVAAGSYAVRLEPPVCTATAHYGVAAWRRGRYGRWQRPEPLHTDAAALAAAVRRAPCAVPRRMLYAASVALADAFDADDEVSEVRGMWGREALVPCRMQPSRIMAAAPLARYDNVAWINLGRLARGWGDRYTDPMHVTVVGRASDVSAHRATLVFSEDNFDAAARRHAAAVRALQAPGVHPLGADHQWRGSWIKAIGRDTDSCLGGALTNLMWLRVVDNVSEGGFMRFDCEPALEDTFHEQFVSNALRGSITYGLAGWHVYGDPLTARTAERLTVRALQGVLVPARCAAELAEVRVTAYAGGAALLRALDPNQRYTVVLHAPEGLQPHGLEVWQDNDFAPVRWHGTRAVLFAGVPQQPVRAAGGEGTLLIVFRIPAAAALRMEGLSGIEVAAAPPESEWYTATPRDVDVRAWELVWLPALGPTQALQRVPLRIDNEAPGAPAGARIRLASDATRITRQLYDTTVPVIPVQDGPCIRITDVQPLGLDAARGLERYRIGVAGTVRVQPYRSNWWVRVWPSALQPARGGVAGASNNVPLALQADVRDAAHLLVWAPPGAAGLASAIVRGAWLESVDDWLAWGGTLALRTPRMELAARIAARDVPHLPAGASCGASGWPLRWQIVRAQPRENQAAAHVGLVRNQPADCWSGMHSALPEALSASAPLAAACADALTLACLPAHLSNTSSGAACLMLDSTAALSNRIVYYSWPPLPRNILRGYYAELYAHDTVYRGLILSNDRFRLVLDMAGRAPRSVASLRCRVVTPHDEAVWYMGGGEPVVCAVEAPWSDTQRARFTLTFLPPRRADVTLSFRCGHAWSRSQQFTPAHNVIVSPPCECSRVTAPFMLRMYAALPGDGVLFTRPAWLPCVVPARPNFNMLASATASDVIPLAPAALNTLMQHRPLAGFVQCAARQPLAADDIWRLADAISFHSLLLRAYVRTEAAGAATLHAADFSILPREGQPTAAVLYRQMLVECEQTNVFFPASKITH